MKWSLVPFFLLSVLLICCGGSKGNNSNSVGEYAGIWRGTFTESINGTNTAPWPAALTAVQIDSASIEFADFCPDGSGPRGTATADGKLQLSPFSCPAIATASCSSFSFQVLSGTAQVSDKGLELNLTASQSGCGQTASVTMKFIAPKTETPVGGPTAEIVVRPSGPVVAGTPVTLDGSASLDAQGRPLTFAWTLTGPSGSTATLSSETTEICSFTPDVPGAWSISLAVTAGGITAREAITITATPAPVIAQIAVQPSLQVNAGSTVTLDGIKSSALDGSALTYSWSLTAPTGSAAILANPSSQISFATDLAGNYQVTLTVRTSTGLSAEQQVTVVAKVTSPTKALSYRPLAARYSRGLDKVVFIADSPASVHLYDPVAQTDTAISLPVSPTCLSLSNDGKLAIVGHNAWLSEVDLAAGSVVKTLQTTFVAGDLVLSEPITVAGKSTRFAYGFPLVDQWVTVHSIDLSTGVDTISGGIYAGMHAVVEPDGQHVFGVTDGLSPAQVYRFDLDPTSGVLKGGNFQSPYWGSYPMAGPLFASADGSSLLTGAGTRFHTGDLTYAGAVVMPDPTNQRGLSWADESPDGSSWLVQPKAGWLASGVVDGEFVVVDAQYLANPVVQKLPGFATATGAFPAHGRWVFYDSTGKKKISVFQADPKAGADQDFAVAVFEEVRGEALFGTCGQGLPPLGAANQRKEA